MSDTTQIQLERCLAAWEALKITVQGYQDGKRADASTIKRVTSERDTLTRANEVYWAMDVNGALENQAVREKMIALLVAFHPVLEAVLNPEVVAATNDALITLQLPDANLRTADGGDEPRQHTVIVLGRGALHVGQFREMARLIEALKRSNTEE